jgi:hypothetical protein
MPSSHQNWQYLGASGYIGAYTTTGGGGTPVVPRSSMDFLRMGVGRTPQAEYPDDKGKPYATSDTVLDSLKARQNQRGYQRGVHKGERIDPGEYAWPDGLKPDRRLKVAPKLDADEGSLLMYVRRHAPNQNLAPAPHLVNDGKANVSANVPAEFHPRTAAHFQHLKPRYQ